MNLSEKPKSCCTGKSIKKIGVDCAIAFRAGAQRCAVKSSRPVRELDLTSDGSDLGIAGTSTLEYTGAFNWDLIDKAITWMN